MSKDLLTPEELRALEAEVQKEIDKDLKVKAKETVRKEMLQKARAARGLEEASVGVMIDLPESADRVTINGVPYVQGRAYSVPASVGAQLRETMHRAWQHQAQIEGRQKDYYTRRNTRMSGATGMVSGGPLRGRDG